MIATSQKYRVLHLEDRDTEAELVSKELRRHKIDCEFLVVDTKEEYINALEQFAPDIILCDQSLRLFDAVEAIRILKAKQQNIPFILLTAKMPEEVANAVMMEGAADYILKDRLKRLPFAVINALEKYRFENERKRPVLSAKSAALPTFEELSALSSKLLMATKVAGLGIWEYIVEGNIFIADELTLSMYGIEPGECHPTYEAWLNHVHPDDKVFVASRFSKMLSNPACSELTSEFRIVLHNGSVRYIKSSASIIRDESGRAIRLVGSNLDTTTSRAAEQVLRESEVKYHSFYENSMDGIILSTSNGKITAANPSACKIFRMTEKEICEAGRAGIVDLNDTRFFKLLAEREKNGQAKGEITFCRKDGSKFPAEVTSSSFRDAFGIHRVSVIIRDSSEKFEAAQKVTSASNALKSALNELRQIMTSSLDIICTIDFEGRFVNVSSAAKVILGYEPSEVVGRQFIDMVVADDKQKTIEVAKDITNGMPVTMFENRYLRKDGSEVPLLWSARWDEHDQLMYCTAKDATEKKRMEAAFESERLRFYELFSKAPASVGIFKGPEHVFEMANEEYLELTGRKDIIGKTVKEVFPEIEGQGLIELLNSVYQTGKSFYANERLIRVDKDGSGSLKNLYLNFAYQAYRDKENNIEGVFFFAIDVTEQLQSRKKIEESEKRYRQIVETAQEGIWMVDAQSKTTFVNRKLCEILGYTKKEMLGKEIYFFMDNEARAIAQSAIENKKRGFSGQSDFKYISKNGKEVWTNISANPMFDENGMYNGSLAMITDIGIRKQQEFQLQKNSEERELLIAELTKSLNDLKQFSYITSHNFRAPLSNLIGLLSLVDHSTLCANNKEIIELFKQSTYQINKTINDLVQILIIRNNESVQVNQNNLHELLKEVFDTLKFEINESKCDIETELNVETISFNKTYLESILLNLLSNSIKYRSKNRPLKIRITTGINTNAEVCMVISDNGMGIDLNRHRNNVFGLYQRFHSNTDGAGLGLFIVKSQITALGGKIAVESELNKGTTFTITFKEKLH